MRIADAMDISGDGDIGVVDAATLSAKSS